MKRFGIVLLVLSYLFLFTYIALLHIKSKPHYNYLSFFVGTVEIVKSNDRIEPAEIKKHLYNKDTVAARNNSRAFIQCGADALVEVNENTEFIMSSLPEKLKSSQAVNAFELLKGRVHVFVERLSETGSFEISTGNRVVSVRGTLFSLEKKNDIITVMVKDGIVEVKPKGDNKTSFQIKKGQKGIITKEKISKVAMDQDDLSSFSSIEALRPLAGIACTPVEYISRFYSWRLDIPDYYEKEKKNKGKEDKESNGTDKTDGKKDKAENHAAPAGVRLGINNLKAMGVDMKEAERITGAIYRRILSKKGAEKVIYRSSGRYGKSVNRQLLGRISKLGKKYIVAVRIVHGEKGSVLFDETVVIQDGEGGNGKINSIADMISSRKAIWVE